MSEQGKYTADFPCFDCNDVLIEYEGTKIPLQAIKIDFNDRKPVSLVVAMEDDLIGVKDRLIRFVISYYSLPTFLQIVVTNYCIDHDISINDLFKKANVYIGEKYQLTIDFWTVVFKQLAQFHYNKCTIDQLPQLKYLMIKYHRDAYEKFIERQKIKLSNQQKMIDQLACYYDNKRHRVSNYQEDLLDDLLDLL